MNPVTSILWRRLDIPGHEYARLGHEERSWVLSGVALLEHDGAPCRMDYVIQCDSSWATTAARVWGWVGHRAVQIAITVDGAGWIMNGEACSGVDGCIDVDLNFSPSTNLLPIRRLNLDVGERAEVRAAWLRFPQFTLEPLMQTYTRVGERNYRYESAGGAFVAELEVNAAGLPLTYGTVWAIEGRGT